MVIEKYRYLIEFRLTVSFVFAKVADKKLLRVWMYDANATFNNISVISWRSVLLVDETGVPGENHRPVTSH
jgi:hypothetical protein